MRTLLARHAAHRAAADGPAAAANAGDLSGHDGQMVLSVTHRLSRTQYVVDVPSSGLQMADPPVGNMTPDEQPSGQRPA